ARLRRRLARLAEAREQLAHRRSRLAGELVLAAAARLLVFVLALDAGCSGSRSHGGPVSSVRCGRVSIVRPSEACATVRPLGVREASGDEALSEMSEAVPGRRQLLPGRRRTADPAGIASVEPG